MVNRKIVYKPLVDGYVIKTELEAEKFCSRLMGFNQCFDKFTQALEKQGVRVEPN